MFHSWITLADIGSARRVQTGVNRMRTYTSAWENCQDSRWSRACVSSVGQLHVGAIPWSLSQKSVVDGCMLRCAKACWEVSQMPVRPMSREQIWMLPPTLDELVPADHPARFVGEFVDALGRDDWAELGVDTDGSWTGAPSYHPSALLGVWLYGFMTGVRSCRKLEAACRDQIPYLMADRMAAS